jgi:imidazolonepropionase-like amidohydrolase
MEREDSLRRGGLRDHQRLLGRIAAGGGRLAAASGAPATPYGLGLHAEIRLLAGAGLSRAQALQTATSEAARTVGFQGRLGVIAPGGRADLLVVAGDPLADLRHLLSIETVIVDGHVRPMSSLVGQSRAAKKFTTAPGGRTANRTRRRR